MWMHCEKEVNSHVFLSADLVMAGRFASTEAFATETSKHALPFRPVAKVGTSNRFAAVDYCLAVAAGHLRGFGMALSAVARLLERIGHTALTTAVSQFQDGDITEIYVGVSAILDQEDNFSVVFTDRAAVADALADLDLIVISVGDRLERRVKGIA